MDSKSMALRIVVQTLASMIVIGVALLAAAGDWLWPQAWAFLGEVTALSLLISFWLMSHDPALLRERLTSPFTGDQRPKDRWLLVAICAGFIAWLVLMGLDARRFEWTTVPLLAQIPGAILIGLCMMLTLEAFRHNSFAIPQVRVQADRAQRVISDGPYRYVRHPMYAGSLLFFVGAPLVLQSLWGLLGAAFLTVGLGLRAMGEEQVLRADLPGYADYAKSTPWRLIPGIW